MAEPGVLYDVRDRYFEPKTYDNKKSENIYVIKFYVFGDYHYHKLLTLTNIELFFDSPESLVTITDNHEIMSNDHTANGNINFTLDDYSFPFEIKTIDKTYSHEISITWKLFDEIEDYFKVDGDNLYPLNNVEFSPDLIVEYVTKYQLKSTYDNDVVLAIMLYKQIYGTQDMTI